MSRLRIEMPDHFSFTTRLEVCIGDINYGQHLANDAILRLVHEARLRFLGQWGYSEKNVAGQGLIMVSAEIVYRGQGRHGDVLLIDVALTELGKIGFDLVYRLRRESDGADIAHVRTSLAFFDYERNRPGRTPPDLARQWGGLPAGDTSFKTDR